MPSNSTMPPDCNFTFKLPLLMASMDAVKLAKGCVTALGNVTINTKAIRIPMTTVAKTAYSNFLNPSAATSDNESVCLVFSADISDTPLISTPEKRSFPGPIMAFTSTGESMVIAGAALAANAPAAGFDAPTGATGAAETAVA